MTDNAYTNADVLRMETEVLQELEFDLNFPTCYSFMETYLKDIESNDDPTRMYTQFLLDRALLELPMQRYLPSILAAGALVAAWRRMNRFQPYI